MIFISDEFCVTVLPVLGLKVGQYKIPQWKSIVMYILLNFTFEKSQHGKKCPEKNNESSVRNGECVILPYSDHS